MTVLPTNKSVPNGGRSSSGDQPSTYLPSGVETPDGHLDDVFGAFLEEAVLTAPMPDFAIAGEPYPALGALVLSTPALASLQELTEAFDRIMAIAVDRIVGDRQFLRRIGFPEPTIALLRREPTGSVPLIGRFDFLRDPTPLPASPDQTGTWRMIEYNADTPSGIREAVTLEPLVGSYLPHTCASYTGVSSGFGPRIIAAVRTALRNGLLVPTAPAKGGAGSRPQLREGPTRPINHRCLAIVTDLGHTEDAAQAIAYQRLLTQHLPDTLVVVGDIGALSRRRGRLVVHVDTKQGRKVHPIDAIYRLYPFEAMPGLEAWDALFGAIADGEVLLLNGLRGLVAQNKGTLAWIWAHQTDTSIFTPAQGDIIRNHLPATCWVDEAMPLHLRSEVIVKQVFGREGEEVAFGRSLTDDAWQTCVAWGSYIAQLRVPIEPLRVAIPTARGHVTTEVWPCIGSFAVSGGWAGCYTRIGGEITRHDAKWCATMTLTEDIPPQARM